MTINAPSELAANMALAACQINAFQSFAADLPRLSWMSYEREGAFELHGYVSNYRESDGTYTSLSNEDQIDVLRTWASALGADLHLNEVSTSDQYQTLHLETRAASASGLHVRICATPYYRRAAQPAPEPVAA